MTVVIHILSEQQGHLLPQPGRDIALLHPKHSNFGQTFAIQSHTKDIPLGFYSTIRHEQRCRIRRRIQTHPLCFFYCYFCHCNHLFYCYYYSISNNFDTSRWICVCFVPNGVVKMNLRCVFIVTTLPITYKREDRIKVCTSFGVWKLCFMVVLQQRFIRCEPLYYVISRRLTYFFIYVLRLQVSITAQKKFVLTVNLKTVETLKIITNKL